MAASSAGLDALTQSARTMQTKLEPVELWRFIADSVEDTHPKVLGALLATAILRAAQ
ncbi:hypothetical protein AB0H76_39015 [Nocardia sp. NPDC050712]|uniref:hypothetical protein n=1 Tax=Nocardia sp. NPDC050712 TaxID=3155518 RepID=UPI0033E3F21A